MTKKRETAATDELITLPHRVLLRDPRTPWVLTSTTRSNFTRAVVITGLSLYYDEAGELYVTPESLDPRGGRTYPVRDYAKSVDNNTGKISFSSNGTRFEVRALRLEDSSWLFPGRKFADLPELIDAVLPSNLRRGDAQPGAAESKQRGTAPE